MVNGGLSWGGDKVISNVNTIAAAPTIVNCFLIFCKPLWRFCVIK
jgi:hypothetical protein